MKDDPAWPWALALSVAGPLALYAWTASPGAYWLDSSELVAGVWSAGVPHPPGHPLYVASSQVAAVWPWGSAALRVAWMSALATAGACGLLAAVVRGWCLRRGVGAWGSALSGLAGAWLVGGSYALWFQAIRAEVYGLHLLIAAALVWLISGLEWQAARQEPLDVRRLYGAGLAAGLGLANHHYLTVFVLVPVLCWALARGAARRLLGSRRGAAAVGWGALGLGVYAWLPVASSRGPWVDWGRPVTWERFVWVVTAQAFQKTLGRAAEVDVGVLASDLFGQLARQLTPVGLVVGLAGLVGASWRGGWRGWGLLVGGWLVGNLATQALFNFDPFNPDVHGYFALSVWLLGLGAGCGVGLAWSAAAELATQGPVSARVGRWTGPAATAAALGLAGLSVWLGWREASRARFYDVEVVNQALLGGVPEGAVVLTSNYKTIFNLWFAQGVQGRRLDVAVVHRNFLEQPAYREEVASRHPEVLGAAGEGNRLDVAGLRALAARRPVLLEYDVNVEDGVLPWLEPSGLLFRVVPAGAPAGALPEEVVRRQVGAWEELEAALAAAQDPEGGGVDLETRRYLVWSHYLTTVALVRQGHPRLARFHLERALAWNPAAPELRALRETLDGQEAR